VNFFARQGVAFRNDLTRSAGALLGIVQGLIADATLNDAEIRFLRAWLHNNQNIAAAWPGNVIAFHIDRALGDGVIAPDERAHLVNVLQQLVGGTLDELADSTHVSELALDRIDVVHFAGRSFCLTGNFCFGTRSACAAAIEQHGGTVLTNVSKKLNYLVVGGLGSEEWKHGSFGTKIAKAMELKGLGLPLHVVHEDPFVAALMSGH
jgi:NAD-dependent DNA ligase